MSPDLIVSTAFLLAATPPGGGEVEVPLVLFEDATYPAPEGVPIGVCASLSFGDLDADGWIDVVSYLSGTVWRNVGGTSWELLTDLDQLLPPANFRYGVSIGDYDRDGLPEIVGEPRNLGGDSCMHLLENLGAAPWFVDVAADASVLSVQPCQVMSETACFGDVDGDGEMDLFLPTYPPQGNFFFHNQGPGGTPLFVEKASASGLAIPFGNARPEGAQLCDVDGDGDLDLYCNGALYQNWSTPGSPLFEALVPASSGLQNATSLEEGAAFFDYDMDGDMDLALAYVAQLLGVVLLENRGDGTFFQVEAGVVESPFTGLGLGLSAEDWDGDGDIDFTTKEVFRRNQLVETGARRFTVATHAIPADHVVCPTPAWGDTDLDGDLDCALGNGGFFGHLYVNTTYDAETPLEERRYVRVRPLRDAPGVPRGLEVEFGAAVEVRVHGDAARRRKFTASSSGYLNQNEYSLTFGLPADPAPADPSVDLRFDVVVDFPGASGEGVVRVDRHVNPALGDVNLAELTSREIGVYRDGRVVVGGVDVPAVVADDPLLTTTGGGLVAVTSAAPLPDLAPSPSPDWWVGVELDLAGSTEPVRLSELILDARLDAPVACGGQSLNVAVWDVGSAPPALVPGGAVVGSTSERNRRSRLPLDVMLEPGSRYRVAARVVATRSTAVPAPVAHPELVLSGGFGVAESSGCAGDAIAAASLDPTQVCMALRFRADDHAWFVLGDDRLPAAFPRLDGVGSFVPGGQVELRLQGAPASAPVAAVLSRSADWLAVTQGVLVPSPDVVVTGLATDASGSLSVSGTVPPECPPDEALYAQLLVFDPTTGAVLLSNAVAAP